jgi:hypothetical protein
MAGLLVSSDSSVSATTGGIVCVRVRDRSGSVFCVLVASRWGLVVMGCCCASFLWTALSCGEEEVNGKKSQVVRASCCQSWRGEGDMPKGRAAVRYSTVRSFRSLFLFLTPPLLLNSNKRHLDLKEDDALVTDSLLVSRRTWASTTF